MITMTINDLLNIAPVLRELINKPFRGATAFKLARLMRELDKENALFEESRMKLIEKYGKKDENGTLIMTEDGSNIKLQEDKLEECNEEMINLISTQIEINADKIPLSAFEEIEIAPSQAISIEILIEE